MAKTKFPRKKRGGKKHDIKKRFDRHFGAPSEAAFDMLYDCHFNMVLRNSGYSVARMTTAAMMAEANLIKRGKL